MKIYRAKLHTKELLDCGFDPMDDKKDNWGIIKGILRAKGLPEWCTQDQTPVETRIEADGILVQFGNEGAVSDGR